jgi:antitoxin MazE
MDRAKTNLAKWGTSLAVRLPKPILDAAHLKAGDELAIEFQDGLIIIQSTANQPTLQDLVDQITAENVHPETGWGRPVGNEAW